ncbi:MAG: hypothetical protein C0504_19560 [Candidatus Solibacter sp.]|nr:hypothetical protein [Candidatus Solibacter sp.]
MSKTTNEAQFPIEVSCMGELVEAASGLDTSSLQYLVAAAEALKVSRGCLTPVEDFVENVLMAYAHHGPRLTPDVVERDLVSFKEEHEALRYVVRRYVHLVDDEAKPAA